MEIVDAIDKEPYKLPDGWKWVELWNVAKIFSGKGFKEKEYSNNGVSLLRITNVSYNEIIEDDMKYLPFEYMEYEKELLLKKNDIVMALNRPITNNKLKASLIKESEKYILYQRVGCFRIHDNIFYMYIFKIMGSSYFKKQVELNLQGSDQPYINIPPLKKILIPLPPLEEQQRIANLLDNLTSKLAKAKELINEARETFEKRRMAILHKAFTGELTREWREENKTDSIEHLFNNLSEERLSKWKIECENAVKNGKRKPRKPDLKIFGEIGQNIGEFPYTIPKEWKWFKIGDMAFVTKLAGFEYTEYIKLEDEGEIPVIRAQNVKKGYIDETNLKYITRDISNILERCALVKKSILMTFIGAGTGDVAFFEKPQRYHLAPNVAKIEFDSENIMDKLVMYYFLSEYGKLEIGKYIKATAQPSLSMETIREMLFPLPPVSEQKEILQILESILSKEEEAKTLTDIEEQIELMEKSILSKAFRGEL